MSKTCCFFGHRYILNHYAVEEQLPLVIEKQILNGCENFLIGSHGMFDAMALKACRTLRKKYPQIKICVVITQKSFFTRKHFPKGGYEYSISDCYYNDVETMTYPIEDEYFKNQIIKNNQLMVDDSDVVICYIKQANVQRGSGAWRAVKYAQKKQKEIINICLD